MKKIADPPTGLIDKPGRSPTNRSLERGIEILRAFRPGSEYLGNAELAERTGLSKATVTRLTQTLVGSGMLYLDQARRAYCLAPAVLSLAHAMRTGSYVLSVAAPLMKELSASQRINVGLAAPDKDEMVYLESIRYNRRVVLRHIVSGQRIPMDLTSLGRAYLAVAEPHRREALFSLFQSRRKAQWPRLQREIEAAGMSVNEHGYCAAGWQAEVVAVATPLPTRDAVYVLNCSLSTSEPLAVVVAELHKPLLALRRKIEKQLAET